ncbi:sarcosine oxidase subunit delta [Sphingomonas oleivorans]|uniref:Sarcosine oxidase subunit delta n=1 Tax=Sphingomonas oleivorans TaxID=1735121 RepID=A0A2T5G0P9_9SPHN|nr:sarcosine oxidase subunit delta [Sphingomonas oleivorans]PTQ12729.1 sarcosine oxidase subunit delta [Sphingomonas oleivorans]
MRVKCPYCGDRDVHEFVYRGDAAPVRPAADAGEAAFADYVYLRDNPAGPIAEHWYHAQGCRNWLVVERDTRSHAIAAVRLAREAAR